MTLSFYPNVVSAIIVLSGSNSRDSASVCEGSDPEEVHRHIEMIHAVWKK